MKRLLEWKQRMLQSPLTRKSSRNTSRYRVADKKNYPNFGGGFPGGGGGAEGVVLGFVFFA